MFVGFNQIGCVLVFACVCVCVCVRFRVRWWRERHNSLSPPHLTPRYHLSSSAFYLSSSALQNLKNSDEKKNYTGEVRKIKWKKEKRLEVDACNSGNESSLLDCIVVGMEDSSEMTCVVIYSFEAIWIKEAISNIGDTCPLQWHLYLWIWFERYLVALLSYVHAASVYLKNGYKM